MNKTSIIVVLFFSILMLYTFNVIERLKKNDDEIIRNQNMFTANLNKIQTTLDERTARFQRIENNIKDLEKSVR